MITIRTYEDSDSGVVHRLFAQGMMDFAGEFEDSIKAYVERSLADDLADIPGNYLSRPGDHFWVAEVDGQVKGIVGIQGREDGEAELRRMSVATDSRRQGIGRKLLETTDEFCRQQGYKRIRLGTASHLLPAVAMYQSAGYRMELEKSFGKVSGKYFVKDLTG